MTGLGGDRAPRPQPPPPRTPTDCISSPCAFGPCRNGPFLFQARSDAKKTQNFRITTVWSQRAWVLGLVFVRVQPPTPPHPHFPPALAETCGKPFSSEFGGHFCGHARGASTARAHGEPIRKLWFEGAVAKLHYRLQWRLAGNLRPNHAMRNSAQAGQTENGSNQL